MSTASVGMEPGHRQSEVRIRLLCVVVAIAQAIRINPAKALKTQNLACEVTAVVAVHRLSAMWKRHS
jgi:hypothetical protein